MTTTVTPTPVEVRSPGRRGWMGRARHGEATSGQGRATPFAKAVVVLICILWFVPVLGIFVTSFRTKDDANSSGWWTVLTHPSFTLSNYSNALGNDHHIGEAFVNSLAVALPATVLPIMVAAFAAYAFAFMRFPFRDAIFILIVSLLVVPNFVALVPLLKIYGNLHMVGTFPAVWLAHIGFGMPLAIYMLRNYMATLPTEVIESAKIDGASHFQTFWRLVIPMSVPVLASFAIFQFLWVWNSLLVELVFLGQGANQTLSIAVNSLLGAQGQNWEIVTAGTFFSVLVPIIVFLSLQRFFVRGLTAGSVKG